MSGGGEGGVSAETGAIGATGFVGPLPEGEWRCPVCGSDPYDQTCHHSDCPTVCPRPILTADYRTTHRCPQTDEAIAARFAAIYGSVALPIPPIPESWKVSEWLSAWDQGREPAPWAARDARSTTSSTGARNDA